MSVKQQLHIEQGATLLKDFIIKQTDGNDVTVVDLTGFTAFLQIRKFYGEDEVLLDASTSNGHITITGVEGKITLLVPAELTRLIPPGRWVYELKLVAPDNITVESLLSGNVIVSPQVVELS